MESAEIASLSAKSYRWGAFQGWLFAVILPLHVLLAVLIHAYDAAIVLAIFSVLGVPLGIGLLKKKRFAIALVYIATVLSAINLTATIVMGGFIGLFPDIVILALWIISAIYYYKRRKEFSVPEWTNRDLAINTAAALRTCGTTIFWVCEFAGFLVSLSIIEKAAGFWGSVVGVVLFPVTITIAPWYALFAWKTPWPLILNYGGMIVSGIFRWAANKIFKPAWV